MKKLVLLALLFSLSATTFMSAQSKKSQKEIFTATYKTSKSVVESEHYQFVANVIRNSQEREILNGDVNKIDINKLSVSGQLHAFSKDRTVHSLQDNSSEISTTFNDDDQEISISIKTNAYTISIDVKPNGNAFLELTNTNNTKLLYTGKLVKL